MELYEMIFCRRSVRKFSMQSLDENVLKSIEEYVEQIKPLEGTQLKTKIVLPSEVSDSKAPHYMLCFCDDGIEPLVNVGYVIQKLDLYLQSIGLGSVWLGTPKPKGSKENDYRIMIGFGKTDVPQRSGEQDFNRLSIEQVSNVNCAVAQAARIAPSAMNSQPWKFVFEDNKVAIKYFGRGLLKGLLKHKFSTIDLGIAARHMELALANEGKIVKSIKPKTDGKDFCVEICWE